MRSNETTSCLFQRGRNRSQRGGEWASRLTRQCATDNHGARDAALGRDPILLLHPSACKFGAHPGVQRPQRPTGSREVFKHSPLRGRGEPRRIHQRSRDLRRAERGARPCAVRRAPPGRRSAEGTPPRTGRQVPHGRQRIYVVRPTVCRPLMNVGDCAMASSG